MLSLSQCEESQVPAERKLHGWSGDGALLMGREIERRQNRPTVPTND